jgi:hypothetical protein
MLRTSPQLTPHILRTNEQFKCNVLDGRAVNSAQAKQAQASPLLDI